MAEQFYTILTAVGKAKIANSIPLGTKVNFKTLKVGDSNGSYYNPTESQTDLVNTKWQGSISSVSVDQLNPNWVVIEVIIPGQDGGFTIREAGIFDDQGDMIAIGKYPETYKPIIADGSTKELLIRVILEVSNADSITMKIDPTVILATKKDIEVLESKMNDLISKFNLHLSDNKNHIPYGIATGSANAYAVSINPAPISYVDGTALCVKINVDSTGASTLNVNGLGAKVILDSLGNKISAGGLKAGIPYTLRYNGTNFIVQGKGGGGNATHSDIRLNKTATTDAGNVIGDMPELGAQTITPGQTNKVISGNVFLAGDQTILGDPELIASNIVSTANIFGVQGTATVASLGGKQYASGTITVSPEGVDNDSAKLYFPANTLPFTPKVLVLNVPNAVGSTTQLRYIRIYDMNSKLTTGPGYFDSEHSSSPIVIHKYNVQTITSIDITTKLFITGNYETTYDSSSYTGSTVTLGTQYVVQWYAYS